jgi:hypothetical protein
VSPRFFIDVSNGEEILPDEVGVEASDLSEVLAEARGVIVEMADEVMRSRPDQSWALIVRDAAGAPVGRLPIKR